MSTAFYLVGTFLGLTLAYLLGLHHGMERKLKERRKL